jgi:pentatricopeptide repeat protein
VLRLLEDAMRQGLASNYVFTMALKGLKIRKNWKAAVALISFMRERGVTPDTVTYTSAISACERSSNCTSVLSLLDLMKARVPVLL